MQRFQYIDALRGYAILAVILGHVSLTASPSSETVRQITLLHSGRGVQLFFVVSALALMFAWHSHQNGVRAFYIRRFFRIAPMFWLVIGFNVLAASKVPFTWDQIASHVLFLHGLSPRWINTVVAGSWTISVEATFYVLFPLLARCVTTLRRSLILLGLSLLVAAACWLPLLWYGETMGGAPNFLRSYAYESFLIQAPCFMTGVVTYFLITRPVAFPSWVIKAAGIASLSVIVGLVTLTKTYTTYVMFALAFGAAALVLSKRHLGFWVHPPICWLGTISYSAYFLHFLIIAALAPFGFSFVSLFALTMFLVCIASSITYLAIERPMINVGNRVSRSYA